LNNKNIQDAEQILKISEKLGAYLTEVIMYSLHDTVVRFSNSLIEQNLELQQRGAFIKIINQKGGYAEAHVKTTNERTIHEVINDILKRGQKTKKVQFSATSEIQRIQGTYVEKTANLTSEEIVESANFTIQTAHSVSKKISKVAGTILRRIAHLSLVNSLGLSLTHDYTGYSIVCTPLAQDGNSLAVGFASRSSRSSSEIDVKSIAVEAAEDAVLSLHPKPINLGRYDTIFQSDAAGDIIGSFIHLGFSIARDPTYVQIGSRCASDVLTVKDEPRNPETLMPLPFDSEGTPTTSLTLIEKGIAKEKCYDKKLAHAENRLPTGHSPFPHDPAYSSKFFPGWVYYPTNQIVEPGQTTQQDMVEGAKRAILVKRLMYAGLPMGLGVGVRGRDIMQAYTMGTWLIENGEIKNPLPCLRLSDSLKRLVEMIKFIGDRYTVKKLGCINSPWLYVKDVHFTEISSLAISEGIL
jgi:predicted Zn-dependent protease